MNGLPATKVNETYEFDIYPGVEWNICKDCGRLKVADSISRCVMAMRGLTMKDHVCKESQ
jgi:hypothetical protein